MAKTLPPPIWASRPAAASTTPMWVMPPMTRNRPNSRPMVSKSMAFRGAVTAAVSWVLQ